MIPDDQHNVSFNIVPSVLRDSPHTADDGAGKVVKLCGVGRVWSGCGLDRALLYYPGTYLKHTKMQRRNETYNNDPLQEIQKEMALTTNIS